MILILLLLPESESFCGFIVTFGPTSLEAATSPLQGALNFTNILERRKKPAVFISQFTRNKSIRLFLKIAFPTSQSKCELYKENRNGCTTGSCKGLSSLLYADDVLLLAQRATELQCLQYILDRLASCAILLTWW